MWRKSVLSSLALLVITRADFYSDREDILNSEDSSYLGSDLELNSQEEDVNSKLMALKFEELDQGFEDSSYPPSYNFFQSKSAIESSAVFQFLQPMPKGGALHLHDIAITSADWVIQNITYRDGLYMCKPDADEEPPLFIWLNSEDEVGEATVTCSDPNSGWRSVVDWRVELGATEFDAYVKSFLVLNVDNPSETYPDIDAVWVAFADVFDVLGSILSYETAFRDYYRQGMEEFRLDNVQYMEVRHTIADNICSNKGPNCDTLSRIELLGMFKELSDEFLGEHPEIRADSATVEEYLADYVEFISAYPDFVVGFDLAGQEDKGSPLIDFADILLQAQEDHPDIKYYFHAGETDWNGQETDLNVMDALLLGTKRIGHGFAIAAHPESKALAIENNVPIEVNPVSNQVLNLVKDLRNHPAAALIEEGFPLVISSDDPGSWDAKGLSFDFYEAFMGLASRLLKKLAFSSIEYGAMSEAEKAACINTMENKWNEWIESIATTQEATDSASKLSSYCALIVALLLAIIHF